MMWLARLALLAAAMYVLLVLAACALQERLIFYPQPPGPRAPAPPPQWMVEPFPVAASDGTALEGWVVRPQRRDRYPAVLYFGGNAEEVSWMADLAPRFGEVALVLVNYRGYGRSGGTPGERALFDDALAIHDAIVRRDDVDPARIAAHGRSLGSAVAVYLASRRRLCGVVLTSPFDSVVALGRQVFPWLPVSLLLRHRFDAESLAGEVDTPLLVLAGDRDRVVPIASSRRLFGAWRGTKELVELPGADHVDIALQQKYWRAIAGFIAGCTGQPGAVTPARAK